MAGRTTLCLATLLLGASCVPQERSRTAAAPVPHVRTAQGLLRGLALDVPTKELAAVPLSGRQAGPAFPPAAAPPFLATARAPDDAQRAEDCLTAAVYYEARSEPLDGQRAVAQVVLNRVRDRAFPNSVCGVVYQATPGRAGCQFTFTCDGSLALRREPAAWDRARRVAQAALAGEVYAPIGSATFYHAMSVMPWWAASMARVGTIGAHLFYRWRGAMENALAFRQSYGGIEPAVGGTGDRARPEQDAVLVHYADRTQEAVTVHSGAVPDTPGPAEARVAFGVRVHVGAAGRADGSPAAALAHELREVDGPA